MDFQEEGPKYFEKKSEILPLSQYGLSSFKHFKEVEEELYRLEQLKKMGLTNDEIKLYKKSEKGDFEGTKVESTVLNEQIQAIYAKIQNVKEDAVDTCVLENQPEPITSSRTVEKLLETLNKKPVKFYPEGHPMNILKNLENELFGDITDGKEIIPLAKRRKTLRRLEKRKQCLEQETKKVMGVLSVGEQKVGNRKTLWDVKQLHVDAHSKISSKCKIIGPKRKTLYTIKDNKIVRLEPVADDIESGHMDCKAVDIVVPHNRAEQLLLEGTKMSVDNIKKQPKFKNYETGAPSQILYLKNIAPTVTRERLTLLFNKFLQENQGLINVRLMTGRMRGQAFVEFRDEYVAVKALQDVNGTIMDGKPIIVQFGKNSNRITDEKRYKEILI